MQKQVINEVDIRRFKKCFIFEGLAPTCRYVHDMTGLTLDNILKLSRKLKMPLADNNIGRQHYDISYAFEVARGR